MALEEYTPQTDFSQDEANQVSGRSTVRTTNLDAEFANLQTSIDSLIARLQAISRDDDALEDGIVTYESLSSVVVALLGSSGYTPLGAWITATGYAQKDLVTNGTGNYVCVVAHTSGTFATDLSAGKWIEIWNSASFVATAIPVTPTGDISATNAQGALAELDSEKMSKAANGSDIANAATFRGNISTPSKAEVQNQLHTYAADAGTSDALEVTLSPAPAAYVTGMRVAVKKSASQNSITNPTLDVNALGAKKIFKKGGLPVAIADLAASAHLDFEYDASYDSASGGWELKNPGAYLSSGANTFTGIQRWAKGADVASANALTLGTDGNYFDITGTTAITSIGTLGVGTVVKLHFDAALTLTNHATDLILPGGANITTAAGDEAEFVEYATGDWRCTNYVPAAFVPSIVAQATAEAGTDTAPRLWTAQRVAQAISALGNSGITLGTSQASTSGTAIDFTGIPSGTKRVSISFSGVSLSGTDQPLIQIGDSGGIEATGYLGASSSLVASTASNNYTTGFGIYAAAAANTFHGTLTLTLIDSASNLWAASGVFATSNTAATFTTAGTKALTGVLDRVRITSTGSNTFDAGTINIAYE